jgi:Sec-independent protein translocase protein TatA
MSDFDGNGFAELLIIVILVVLFVFGSSDIDSLTDAPSQS